ncbi:MAG: hypothetical protein NTW29_22305 [Bacteroidetes bacterium]|nr:hypothetical protein [Bacteroidota bacterium]
MIRKKISLSLLLAFLSQVLFAQVNFTITYEDMPAPAKAIEVRVYQNFSKIRSTAKGDFGSRDFSLMGEGEPTSMDYYVEDDPYFTEANMILARKTSKNFVKGFVYFYSSVLAFHGDAVYEAGIGVPEQSYPLTSFTGNAADHLDIPEQHSILEGPKKIIEFPMQEGSNWSSESRRTVNFNLTVEAYGLKNVPAQHVWTVYREEKITGYGKIRVYHPDGPSEYYEVLKSEIKEYAVDSFYIGGKPAPDALLKAFGAVQGQKINIENKVNFYRKGHFNFLLCLYFGEKDFDDEAKMIYADMDVDMPEK